MKDWCLNYFVFLGEKNVWNMRWRAPDQEVDQRGHGERLCKKIAKHIHRESKKGCHSNHGYKFVNSWWICKILSLLERPVNFQENQY